MTERINARLPEALANHVARVAGPGGLFETPSEYIRDLIRRDMQSEHIRVYDEIARGWQDMAAGRYFEGSGDFKKDMQILAHKQKTGWSS